MTAINNSWQFHGRDDEDAPAHINRLTCLCSTFSIEGVNLDARYLQVFPFSVAGRAATWLDSQPVGTFTTWAGLRDAFLAKYFPPTKASRLQDQIHSFRMEPDERYHLAWERFQTLLSRCSQHGLSDWALVEKFYNGLTPECKARFDTSVGGHLMGKKFMADCNDLFEIFAHVDIDHSATSRTSIPVTTSSSARGVNQVVSDSKVASQLDYITNDLLEIKKKVDGCEVCRGGHDTVDCPTLTLEQVEYIAGQNRGPSNPFNNSNSNWRSNNYGSFGNPPGFPSGQYQSRGAGFYSSGGSGQSGQFASSSSGGQLRSEGSNQEGQPRNEGSSDLQRQVGDIARQLQERPAGQFSRNTKPNPSGTLKAISTRSGRILGEVVRPESIEVEKEEPVDEEIEMEAPGKVQPRLIPASSPHTGGPQVENSVEKRPTQIVPSPTVDLSHAPYPSRLKNQTYSKEYGKFLEIFKKLRVNLPFIEAHQSMPKYVKFLKDLLKSKDRLGEVSNIPLSGGCSAVVLNKVPEKLTDPGLSTIPCLFGSDTECRALADLGASINLMPYSMYERLGLGELSPTRMSLSLADRSVKYPRGIIENLLVKVDKFIFPVDFVILDMEADEKVPIILGRPFLCTAKAIIDVFNGKITLQVGEERVTFKIACSMEHPNGSEDLSSPLEGKVEEVVEKVEEIVSENEGGDETEWVPEVLELSEVKSEIESTPVEKPAPLELKVLPSHLEYAFLGEGSAFPIIISSKLEEGKRVGY
ncbi:uncharacterized protein LOC110906392 [Helianthus annuus]|uniref:uncharacterized protein LOC110906392 n=1 Tax=Helianthus annuus TaxID=4232 RepID=UPI000B8FCB40|nr:uncharacterized protein LOC110906392 [Helianthus annuus]